MLAFCALMSKNLNTEMLKTSGLYYNLTTWNKETVAAKAMCTFPLLIIFWKVSAVPLSYKPPVTRHWVLEHCKKIN